MQGVDIICLGKLSERYLQEGCKEYEKRLTAFCSLRIVEIEPVALGAKNPAKSEVERALKKEADKILAAIRPGSMVVALCIEGKNISSEGLEKLLFENATYGSGHVTFIVGSSHGLHPIVKEKSLHNISLSSMTFPHQLFRLMLMEQIYRAYTIQANMPYHK